MGNSHCQDWIFNEDSLLTYAMTADRAGKQPKPLRTNWPYADYPGKKRKEKPSIFYIDSRKTGETLGECHSAEEALKMAKMLNGVVRGYVPKPEEKTEMGAKILQAIAREGVTVSYLPSDEEQDKENAKRRQDKRLGIV